MTSDYERITRAQRGLQREPANVPPEIAQAIRGLLRLTVLVCLSPVLLWIAWLFVRAATKDLIVDDHGHLLLVWGICVIPVAALFLMKWPGGYFFRLRKAGLVATLLATAGVAMTYAYLALDSHADAAASAPERAFELSRRCGRHCTEAVHQRADGTMIEGGIAFAPVPYAPTCTLVQRLDGDHGFSWVRVLERSMRPAHELPWPIRREDCFGREPVSSLRG